MSTKCPHGEEGQGLLLSFLSSSIPSTAEGEMQCCASSSLLFGTGVEDPSSARSTRQTLGGFLRKLDRDPKSEPAVAMELLLEQAELECPDVFGKEHEDWWPSSNETFRGAFSEMEDVSE